MREDGGTGGKADIADRLAEGFLSFALLGWYIVACGLAGNGVQGTI